MLVSIPLQSIDSIKLKSQLRLSVSWNMAVATLKVVCKDCRVVFFILDHELCGYLGACLSVSLLQSIRELKGRGFLRGCSKPGRYGPGNDL